MSSQHVQQRAKGKATQANNPQPIDTSGRKLPSNSADGARARPQLPTNQDFDVTNNQLLMAARAIEESRTTLFNTWVVASSALQELDHEQQARHSCSNAYKELHTQYGEKIAELHKMTTKCLSLHNELDEAQKTISDYGSVFKEFESRVTAEKAQHKDMLRDLEEKGVRTAQQIQVAFEKELNKTLAREALALQNVDKVEKEMEHLIEEHRAEINMMVARESLGVQRIGELQKRVDGLVRERQATMGVTVDRMNSAEQEVDEFRNVIGTSEHQGAASTCLTPSPELSPGAVKRPGSETKPRRGRPSKYRKCKDAPNVGGDSNIE